jgi:hypothetical protein
VQQLASGSGEYSLEPETEEDAGVARIAHEFEDPIHRLRQALRTLSHDTAAYEEPLREIEASLLAISRLVHDLGFAVVRPHPIRSSVLCGASVLVVGEDIEQLRSLSQLLREEGVTPVTATSAPECIVRVTAQRPEVVIADRALGATLASMLSAVAPQLPMIVVAPPYSRMNLLGLLETVLLGPHARMR